MTAWIKIFVRLWWLNDVVIKYISDKKIITFLWKKSNKINWNLLTKFKWNGSKKIKFYKKKYLNIILKKKKKGSQRELMRDACEINCWEVVFWNSIQQLLAKAHSIQFHALKKSTFFSKYLIDIVLGLTSP